MNHVALLGDSIFDNRSYVGSGPDVITQLRDALPNGWRATLLAVDGNVIADIPRQLRGLPADTNFLAVSVGGNDAIQVADILNRPARSTADALLQLADIADQFEQDYRAMLGEILQRQLPTALCTIYYPRLPDSLTQRLAVTALTVFNDCIIRAAFAAGLPVLDLRLICSEDHDYANPIEPSVQGGAKIARAIKRVMIEHDFKRGQTEVFI